MKYKDKKDVYMLSALHDETTTKVKVRGRKNTLIDRPKCVVDYNKQMGGVDKVDQVDNVRFIHSLSFFYIIQMLQPYICNRKMMKWYKKLVIHFLQMAMLNAFLLHKKDGGKLSFLKLQMEVNVY